MPLPLQPPLKPMLAKPAKAIPDSGGLLFEPKWDGFRCIVFRDGDELYLQSRAEKPLNRYFPEAVARLLETLPPQVVLDGELVVARDGRLDFDALTERIHPAESRDHAAREPSSPPSSSRSTCSPSATSPCSTNRRRPAANASRSWPATASTLTPATTDPDTARHWFELFEGAGPRRRHRQARSTSRTRPGKRVMFKYKHVRTADCVLAGLRWHVDGGPGDGSSARSCSACTTTAGVLHHVGTVGVVPEGTAPRAGRGAGAAGHRRRGPPVGRPGRPGGASGSPAGSPAGAPPSTQWVPLRPERVVEVAYENTEGGMPSRFRHNARFVRWRPDREPASCDYGQLDEPARYDLDAVFRGQVVRTR